MTGLRLLFYAYCPLLAIGALLYLPLRPFKLRISASNLIPVALLIASRLSRRGFFLPLIHFESACRSVN